MKLLLQLALCVLVAVSLVGCGSHDESPIGPTTDSRVASNYGACITAGQAVTNAQRDLGSRNYIGYCLKAVYKWCSFDQEYSNPEDAKAHFLGKGVFRYGCTSQAGAWLFFRGSDAKIGHVALSAGNGYMYNPGANGVTYVRISSLPNLVGYVTFYDAQLNYFR